MKKLMIDEVADAPQSRYHCPGCGHVTLVSLGREEVVCEGCGKLVTETCLGLDCLTTLLVEMEKYGALDMNATFTMPGAYSPGEPTNEEISYRMRQIANRILHLRHAGEDGKDEHALSRG